MKPSTVPEEDPEYIALDDMEAWMKWAHKQEAMAYNKPAKPFGYDDWYRNFRQLQEEDREYHRRGPGHALGSRIVINSYQTA